MTRPLVRFSVVVIVVTLLPGCALWKKRTEKKQRAAIERALAEGRRHPMVVGKITLVNDTDRFALIDATSTQPAPSGTAWRAYSNGELTAELRSTGVRRRPWVIADIVQGKPRIGDTVLQPAELEPATAPRAEAVQHDAAAVPAQPRPFWKRWLGKLGLTH